MAVLKGIIVKITGGFYYVEADNCTYECKARGVFRKRGCTPLVGDYVCIDVPDGDGYCSIESIDDRKNSLVRPALANLDVLVERAFDDQCTGANPVYPLMEDIRQIYIDAYNGVDYTGNKKY